MSTDNNPHQNHLLAALPKVDYERLAVHLHLVTMTVGDVLYEPGKQLQYAYFPTTSIVSLHHVMEDGDSAEAAGVGNEGVVGVSLFMNGGISTSSAAVLISGNAYRLEAHQLKEEFHRAGPMQQLLLRYTQALLSQMAQSAACQRSHSTEQRFCSWLLLTLDRLFSHELVVTQEHIAYSLGVRRESVTEAAQKLQSAGFIRYKRGHFAVLDRVGLETHACECYRIIHKELVRLLSDVHYRQNIPAF